jgi:tetratricopeptide (TPR) repeat protein
VTAHPDRIDILMYVERDTAAAERIRAHLDECADCAAVAEEYERIIGVLSDPAFRACFDGTDDKAAARESLLAEYDAAVSEKAAARTLFAEMLNAAPGNWPQWLDGHPEHRTLAMADEVFRHIETELNRAPQRALELTSLGEAIGRSLPLELESHTVLGDAWRYRSSALRHLGRYDEALNAASVAEAWYSSVTTGSFDVAQAQYARAVTLFKMTRHADASAVIASADQILSEFGESLPLARARMLHAAILIEEGDVDGAQERWREVLPMLARFGASVEEARVLANLGDCNLRLGNLDAAAEDARLAVQRYTSLSMETESIRSEWALGMVCLARGDSEQGLGVLDEAAAGFEARGMVADAGFVKLDVCEELLRRGEWSDAEVIARELVALFTAAGVTLASVNALHYLRQAVERHEASAEAVRNVRELLNDAGAADAFRPQASPK